ncbi:MAG: hypothetical protein R2748_12195 [Bryobacterales bacterium]
MTNKRQETACPRCCCIVPSKPICSHCGNPLDLSSSLGDDGQPISASTKAALAELVHGVIDHRRQSGRSRS